MGFEPEIMTFRYSGLSMWPFFLEGDLLLVDTRSATPLRRGDCVVFHSRDNDAMVAHRVVAVRPHITTKGDNRPVVDDFALETERIIGRVSAVVRNGRMLSLRRTAWSMTSDTLMNMFKYIDPVRPGRGGRVGKIILSGLRPLGVLLVRLSSVVAFHCGQETTSLMIWRGRLVARKETSRAGWYICWPWSLLLDPRELRDIKG